MFNREMMFAAAERGDAEAIAEIAAKDPSAVDARAPMRSAMQQTPLFAAAARGHVSAVAALLSHGADANARCHLGRTPLIVAAEAGQRGSVEVLLTRGGADVNGANDDGRTALVAAARMGHADVAALLLSHGADARKASTFGRTPLYAGAWSGSVGVVALLLAHAADTACRADRVGRTPLFAAAAEGHVGVIELLLASPQGFGSLGAVDKDGFTALHESASFGRADAVRALIKAGADANARIGNLCTALHIAADNGHADAITVLAEGGADIDAEDALGYTPLIHAVAGKHAQAVRALLLFGASCDLQPGTLLSRELFRSSPAVQETLLSLGFVPASVREDLAPKLPSAGLPATVLLVGDDAKERAMFERQWNLEAVPQLSAVCRLWLTKIDGRAVRMRLINVPDEASLAESVAKRQKSHLQHSSGVEVVAAVILSSFSCKDMLRDTLLRWLRLLKAAGFDGHIIELALTVGTSAVSEARSIASGLGLHTSVVGSACNPDSIVDGCISTAVRLCFSPKRVFLRKQALALASGLHPRLGTQSPLMFIDSFVARSILEFLS